MKLPLQALAPVLPFLLLLLGVPAVGAADLYTGSVPVLNQSVAQREDGMARALRQVLQKITGLQQFDEFPEAEVALAEARAMAISFSYSNRATLLPDGERANELHLVVNFDPDAVDQTVVALQLPIWKPERRPLTIWLLVDDGFNRRIMPVEYEYAWRQMSRLAIDRGMPVALPEPDGEGGYAVDPQLLWGGYTEELAEDGPADALVVAARREGPEWLVRMNLQYGQFTWTWRNRGIELQQVVVDGMNQVIDQLVAIQSIAAADLGRQEHDLVVTGLVRAADYQRTLAYLQSLSLVKHVGVRSAAPGRVRFRLSLTALPEYLLTTLESDGVLTATGAGDVYALTP